MALVIVSSPVDARPKWYIQLKCKCSMDVERTIVPVVRVASTAVFLYYGFTISWQSITALIVLLCSFLLLKPRNKPKFVPELKPEIIDTSINPLKGKPRISESELPDEEICDVEHKVCKMVTYDAHDVESLKNFQVVKDNTECVFAKRAKHWGSQQWREDLTLEENVRYTIPTFYKFCLLCERLGLDGFLYELPGDKYGQDVCDFGDAVRRVLKTISDHDPRGRHCMDKSDIDKKGWVFEFNGVTFFITTFAPCYPETSSRYAFDSVNAYILFQPEVSFAQHDLPPDTVETQWDDPQTVRDKTRVGFRKAGRQYRIRETLYYPMAHDIVKPLSDYGNDDVVEWWLPSGKSTTQSQCPFRK